MAKEFGEARCPLVTNTAVLEAYISIVAPMSTSVGVNSFCCCLSIRSKYSDSNRGRCCYTKSHDLLYRCTIEAC